MAELPRSCSGQFFFEGSIRGAAFPTPVIICIDWPPALEQDGLAHTLLWSGLGLGRRRLFWFVHFFRGINLEEQVIRQEVFVVIAFSVQFHIHLGGPREPER